MATPKYLTRQVLFSDTCAIVGKVGTYNEARRGIANDDVEYRLSVAKSGFGWFNVTLPDARVITTSRNNAVKDINKALKPQTEKQLARQNTRDSGKYAKYVECECCGKNKVAESNPYCLTSDIADYIGYVPMLCENCFDELEKLDVAEQVKRLS